MSKVTLHKTERQDLNPGHVTLGFPGGSVSNETACNAGDVGSIPGWGRSPGKGNGYPLQYSWASLVAQLVKNPPSMWETWVRSLGGEDPLEKGMANHSSIVAWRIPWTVEPGRLQSMGSQRAGNRNENYHLHHHQKYDIWDKFNEKCSRL